MNHQEDMIHVRDRVISSEAGLELNLTIPQAGIWGTASVDSMNIDGWAFYHLFAAIPLLGENWQFGVLCAWCLQECYTPKLLTVLQRASQSRLSFNLFSNSNVSQKILSLKDPHGKELSVGFRAVIDPNRTSVTVTSERVDDVYQGDALVAKIDVEGFEPQVLQSMRGIFDNFRFSKFTQTIVCCQDRCREHKISKQLSETWEKLGKHIGMW